MTLRVYLVAASEMLPGWVQFTEDRQLSHSTLDLPSDPELLVESAGRLCYMSFGERQYRKSNRGYISNLISQGHESVLEHASFSLVVDGASRALTHQLVRHRVGFAYSQLSQQYHDESAATFSVPSAVAKNPAALAVWRRATADSLEAYGELIKILSTEASTSALPRKEQQRFARTLARGVMPNATATTIMVSGNARAWRHLLTVRGSISGDPEMRDYCVHIAKALKHCSPNLFLDFELARDDLGEYVTKTSTVPPTKPAPKRRPGWDETLGRVKAGCAIARFAPTNWVLLTGAPGSGKTSLAEALRGSGARIIDDPGRAALRELAQDVDSKEDPRADYLSFQYRVLRKADHLMSQVGPAEPAFVDYGLAESIAFLAVAGHEVPEVFIRAACKVRFQLVFLLQPLDIPLDDPIRRESRTHREELYRRIRDLYIALGYDIVDVPAVPLNQRADFVLKVVHDRAPDILRTARER